MCTIKTGQVCKVVGWGKLLDEDAFNRVVKPLGDYPSAERGDLVIILGEFRTGADEYKTRYNEYITKYPEDAQFVQVLHPKSGTGWISTSYLEPMIE